MKRVKVQVVKRIETKRYSLTLGQATSGLYYIQYVNAKDENKDFVTDSMEDLNIALYVFDLKYAEFEGN